METPIVPSDPSSKKPKDIRLVIAVILTAIAAGGMVYVWAMGRQTELTAGIDRLNSVIQDLQRQNQGLAAQVAEMTAGDKAEQSAALEEDDGSHSTKYCTYTLVPDGSDQKLIRTSRATGKEEVAVASVRSAIKDLRLKPSWRLKELSSPADSEKIVYTTYLEGTEDAHALFQYDTRSATFKGMLVNVVYEDRFGIVAISPNKTKMLWVPESAEWDGNAKKMYLADLTGNSYKELVVLKGNETFNGGGYGPASEGVNIGWRDDSRIKYSVYDAAKKKLYDYEKDPEGTLKAVFIAERVLELQ